MKHVFTIFVFLCCYLPARYAFAQLGSHDANSCGVNTRDASKQKVTDIAMVPHHVITQERGVKQTNLDLICMEDEAEENVHKRPVCRFVSAFSRMFFSNLNPYTARNLFCCRYLPYVDSYKYISQRVLRI